jgi:hypothetical protein
MYIYKLAAPALLLASCVIYKAPPVNETAIPVLPNTVSCKTPCGMTIDNMEPEQCGALIAYEPEVVAAYQETAHQQNVCGALGGWHLLMVDTENGLWKAGRQWVHGATVCDSQLTFLGEPPATRRSALAHEIGHILECRKGSHPAVMHQHDGWRDRGFCDAIRESSDLDIPCERDAVPYRETQRAAH